MIVVSGGLKGGSGKSTIATNLAVMRSLDGHDVLLVDADEQGTASTFTALRNHSYGDAGYTVVSLAGAGVQTEIMRLKDKYDDIIIDVGGRDTTSLRSAMVVTDVFLLPCLPRSFDTWPLKDFEEILLEMKIANPNIKVLSFLNRADVSGNDNDGAADEIRKINSFKFINTPLVQRKAFSNANGLGQAVTELKGVYKDTKAAEEIIALYKYVFNTNLVQN